MIKKKNRIFIVLLTILLISTLVGCSSSEPTTTEPSEAKEPTSDGEVKGLSEAFAEQPIALTSVGQSADVEMVKALMDNAGLDYTINKVLKGEELGDAKTLVLAVGGSSKGLGAAGIDADDELVRTISLIEAAKEEDIKIIAMHIGGENRRGELSDKFIEPACSVADYIIIVEDGNKDGLFTNIASNRNIPMDSVTSIADAMEPLTKAFK